MALKYKILYMTVKRNYLVFLSIRYVLTKKFKTVVNRLRIDNYIFPSSLRYFLIVLIDGDFSPKRSLIVVVILCGFKLFILLIL